MQFNMTDLMNSLTIMWQGMVGIFVVMVLIAFIVYLLSKIPSKKNNKDE